MIYHGPASIAFNKVLGMNGQAQMGVICRKFTLPLSSGKALAGNL